MEEGLAQRDIAQAGLINAGPCEREHCRALVDADRTRRPRAEKLEHAASASAEIEQVAVRLRADHGDQRRLNSLLRRVEGADLVPVGSALGEIGGRLPAPGLAHDFEPGAIGADHGISRIETAQPVARQRPARFGEAEKRPGALALPGGETRLDQKLEMT